MLLLGGSTRPSKLVCGRRDLFTTGPGPDAGGSKPGKEGCDQIPEKSGIEAAPWAALLADGTAAGACPKAGVAAAAASVTNTRKSRPRSMISSWSPWGIRNTIPKEDGALPRLELVPLHSDY